MSKMGSTELHQFIVKNILLLMTTKDSRVWANNTGVGKDLNSERVIRFGLKGSSDIIGIYKGLFLGIEVKTGNAKQNKFQKNFEKMVCNLGGIYVIVRESNVKQVLNIVEQRYKEIRNGY